MVRLYNITDEVYEKYESQAWNDTGHTKEEVAKKLSALIFANNKSEHLYIDESGMSIRQYVFCAFFIKVRFDTVVEISWGENRHYKTPKWQLTKLHKAYEELGYTPNEEVSE